MDRARDQQAILAQLNPVLDSGPYRFVAITPDIAPVALGSAIATFREAEGVSAIIPAGLADDLGVSGPIFSRITLAVYSDLESVGLTATVSTALAEANISCNMVAAFHHDHVFVPADHAKQALTILQRLAAKHRAS